MDKISISPKVLKKVNQFLRTTAFSNDNEKNASGRRLSEFGVDLKRTVRTKAEVARKVNRFLKKNGFTDNKKNGFKNASNKNVSGRKVSDTGRSVKNRISKRK